MSKFETLENKMCEELESIEQKFKNGAEMSETDLNRIDKLAHAMKSLATYKAMKEAEEYGNSTTRGYSGRSWTPPVNRNEGGYAEGYSRGYSEAMGQMGHWRPTW